MKVLIIGDSHTGALKRGLDKLTESADPSVGPSVGHDYLIRPLGPGANMAFPFWRADADSIEITNEDYHRQMPCVPPPRMRQPDAIGLCMPMWWGRSVSNMGKARVALAGLPSGRAISYAVFRQMVLADMAHVLGLAETLQARGFETFAVEPPSAFRDNRLAPWFGMDWLLGHIKAHRAIMTEAMAERGIPIIRRPDHVSDDEGFTLQQYRHPDPQDAHHANADFGIVMLHQIEGYLSHAEQPATA